jgi:hypothetical protein
VFPSNSTASKEETRTFPTPNSTEMRQESQRRSRSDSKSLRPVPVRSGDDWHAPADLNAMLSLTYGTATATTRPTWTQAVRGDLEIVQFRVLVFSANVHVTDSSGQTPLHTTTHKGYHDIAQLSLGHRRLGFVSISLAGTGKSEAMNREKCEGLGSEYPAPNTGIARSNDQAT